MNPEIALSIPIVSCTALAVVDMALSKSASQWITGAAMALIVGPVAAVPLMGFSTCPGLLAFVTCGAYAYGRFSKS